MRIINWCPQSLFNSAEKCRAVILVSLYNRLTKKQAFPVQHSLSLSLPSSDHDSGLSKNRIPFDNHQAPHFHWIWPWAVRERDNTKRTRFHITWYCLMRCRQGEREIKMNAQWNRHGQLGAAGSASGCSRGNRLSVHPVTALSSYIMSQVR